MSYFLSNQNLELGKQVSLDGEEARHILLSRRIKAGENVVLQGVDEKRFFCDVVVVLKNRLDVLPKREVVIPQEPEVKITLFQAFVAEQALDFILQKSTELGAAKIVLFNSINTATKLTKDRWDKKQARWQKILWESAKQSDRAHPPELEYADDVNEKIKELDKVFLCDPSGEKLNVKGQMLNVGLVIGPEGGFTPEEINEFKSLPNVTPISLGPILLRAETAALASLAILRNILE